jgi:hypothetical protein
MSFAEDIVEHVSITSRDRRIVRDLMMNRVMSRADIRERHFKTCSIRTANRRIAEIMRLYPNDIGEEWLSEIKNFVLCARPLSFGNTTYLAHDYVVSRIRFALEKAFPSSVWISETEVRLNSMPLEFGLIAKLPRLDRIPDGVWVPYLDHGLVGIEYERTFKDRIRIRNILLRHESGIDNPFSKVLIFAGSQTIANGYLAAMESVREKVPHHQFRTHVFNLEEFGSLDPAAASSWGETLVDHVSKTLNFDLNLLERRSV